MSEDTQFMENVGANDASFYEFDAAKYPGWTVERMLAESRKEYEQIVAFLRKVPKIFCGHIILKPAICTILFRDISMGPDLTLVRDAAGNEQVERCWYICGTEFTKNERDEDVINAVGQASMYANPTLAMIEAVGIMARNIYQAWWAANSDRLCEVFKITSDDMEAITLAEFDFAKRVILEVNKDGEPTVAGGADLTHQVGQGQKPREVC